MIEHEFPARRASAATLAVLLLAVTLPARADLSWSVDAKVGRDDNVGLAAGNAQSSTTEAVGGSLLFDQPQGRLKADVAGSGQFNHYADGNFKDQVVGSADGSLRYEIVPEMFSWSLADTFGQGQRDLLAPANPQNRVNINVFSTGPQLLLPIGERNVAKLDARYGHDTYGDARPNDNRYTGAFALVRRLSPSSNGSLNASFARVEYAVPGIAGYDLEQAYARFETTDTRQGFSVDAGAARTVQSGSTNNNPILRVDWRQRLTGYLSLSLGAGREVTDTSGQFQNEVRFNGVPRSGPPAVGPPQTTQTLPLSNQPFRSDYVRGTLSFERARTRIALGASYVKERYLTDATANGTRKGFNAALSRQVTARVSAQLAANYQDRSFGTLNTSDRTTFVNAGVTWAFARNLSATLGYYHERRNSDSAGLSYSSNRYVLGVRYAPGRRAGASPALPAMPSR